jgi:hypothetical protein
MTNLSWLCAAVLIACNPVASDPLDEPVTVSDTGLYVDGDLRWSPSATPILSGTVSVPDTVVRVTLGGREVAAVTAKGNEWSLPLPADLIATTPTTLTFSARGASIVRTFVVDTTPVEVSASPTEVKNELHDVITLAGDGTILSQEHVDLEPSVLGGEGCPDVFKHAFLMDPDDSNPLRWQLHASDDGVGFELASALVRIGLRDGSRFGPWRTPTGVGGDAAADFTVDLVRSGDQANDLLVSAEGPMVIQFAIQDRLGRESVLERCWTNHPLGVPLFTEPGASAPATGGLSLFTHALGEPTDINLMTDLINPGSSGLATMEYDLFNGTDETAFVTSTLNRPALTTQREYVHQSAYLQIRDLDGSSGAMLPIPCDGGAPECEPLANSLHIRTTGSGVIESPSAISCACSESCPMRPSATRLPARAAT